MKSDSFFLQEVINKISDLEKRVASIEVALKNPADGSSATRNKDTSQGKPLAFRELIRKAKPEGDVNMTLAIGYYLEKYNLFSSFNIKEIDDSYNSAKIPAPVNIGDKIQKNIAKGYMMKAKEKKDGKTAWVLTASGEEFIGSMLEGKE